MHEQRRPTGEARTIGRRALLRGALGATGGAAGVAILAACGGAVEPTASTPPTAAPRPTTAPTAAPPTAAPATQGAPTLPAATTATGSASAAVSSPAASVEGKIPSPAPGVPDAFTKLPPVFTTVTAVPGKGSKVTIFDAAYFPPVPPRGQNRYWQELEKRLGVTVEPTFVPSSSYNEKFAALAASGDFADLTNLVGPTPDHLRLIQQGAFTDLTPYLTGSALTEYPNLARYPPQLWKNAAIKGKLYGMPRPLPLIGDLLAIRRDWATKFVASPKNADEFYDLMVKFTKNDPDGNGKADTWGLGSGGQDPFAMAYMAQVFRAPNNWRRNADDTLTKDLETDEYRAAVAYARGLFEAGIYHPDSATMSAGQLDDAILTQKIGARTTGAFGLPGPGKLWDRFQTLNPALGNPLDRLGQLLPFAHDGGARISHNASGVFGLAAIPAKVGKDTGRVQELLRVLNYYAAPFGSEEWLLMNYGLAGVHHTIGTDGSPEQTDLGKKEIGDFWHLATGERVYFYPTPPGGAKYMQDVTRDILAVGIEDPTRGLSSPTNAAKGGELNQLRIDRIVAIVTGREPLAAFDQYVKDWRSRGGDQIRKEYQDALKG